MANFDVEKLHRLQTDILKEVDKICKAENLKYFISGGTLIGAVRHKGFIPWDDDIDIGMLRSDYEKFLEVADNYLDGEKYYIQTMFNDDNFGHSFAKVRLKGTLFIEYMSGSVGAHNEIFIDIFPYDNAPEGKVARFFHGKAIYIKKHLLWSKTGYNMDFVSGPKKLLYTVSDFIAKFCSKDGLKKSLEKSLTKYDDRETASIVTNGSYKYSREILKREWATDLIPLDFEGCRFMGPRDYDGFLTKVYGNYMELPPEDQRDKHLVQKVDFGSY